MGESVRVYRYMDPVFAPSASSRPWAFGLAAVRRWRLPRGTTMGHKERTGRKEETGIAGTGKGTGTGAVFVVVDDAMVLAGCVSSSRCALGRATNRGGAECRHEGERKGNT